MFTPYLKPRAAGFRASIGWVEGWRATVDVKKVGPYDHAILGSWGSDMGVDVLLLTSHILGSILRPERWNYQQWYHSRHSPQTS